MRRIVINLPVARERREAIKHEFHKIGLEYELWPAISRFDLTSDTRQLVDQKARARRGMFPMDDGTIACNLSHYAVLRSLADSGDDMAAIFEDDAKLHPDIVNVLDALEGKADKFDVVKLQRRRKRPYLPVFHLTRQHTIGRIRYHDFGGEGYVITRRVATYLLNKFPRPFYEIDQIIPRYWETGLRRILYLDPPVVFHEECLPSYIEDIRRPARYASYRNPVLTKRRFVATIKRVFKRRTMFHQLRREDRNVDPLSF